MLSKFRRSVMPKNEAGPADMTYHAPSRPGEPCHACGRPMPSMAELPPSPPLTASPPPSVGDDYYFEDNTRQNEEAWSSLNNSNHHSSNSNNSIITTATSTPEVALGLQFRPLVRQGTWTSSIYSPQTPVSSGKDAGWYSRTNMARSGQVRLLSTAIERVDEDSEYAFDLPKRTLSNYSQSFETPGSRVVSNDEQMQQQQQLLATPPTQPLRFPQGLAILAAQEGGPAAAADEDISPSNVEAPANNLTRPPPMPMGAPPPPPPRWRRRTISSIFHRDSKPSSIKSRGRRSISSLY
ncbi:hypothetical protein GGTG_08746 [Gaeumannomyces tritici R3-111a-1]|uniref:Uncharacterized protein n=1 Tax=Gaeumannomyces tritici (strain R3-111a-1) TaxID=644352 RepID=J3P5F7_GAET3|nr:hypothetical protein GGTG_08746 [Gaeumannomyces tritici R3-111a-1]EJT74908.1 hypothetical protein GGTG_08746 [Gaeumannomyces tritici R3-111a-1]